MHQSENSSSIFFSSFFFFFLSTILLLNSIFIELKLLMTLVCIYILLQPPRSAHPEVRFSCTPTEPIVMESLPFDKYELEPSPLTQYILERRQPNVAWQV